MFQNRIKKNQGLLEILCTPKENENIIPKGQKELYLQIEDTINVIDSSNLINEKNKNYYIEKLYDIARTGLSIDTIEVYPELSIQMLKKLKQEVCLKESGRIKNDYLKNLGIHAILNNIIAFGLLIIFKYLNVDLSKYIYAYIGSTVGSWISFNARKLNLRFEELCIIEKDGLEPIFRIIHNGLCAIIVILFINTDIISISISEFNTNMINNSIEMQVLLGVIIGLIDYPISQKIFNKASSIVDEL